MKFRRGAGWFLNCLAWLALILLPACTSKDAAADRGKLFRCLSLEPTNHYIFYQVITRQEEDQIWAFDVQNKKSVLLPEALDSVQMSTPPGRDWLTFDNNSINTLDLNTCQVQPIYTLDPAYKYFHTVWLSKDLLLINAFQDWPFSPHLYILDLKTKKAEKLAEEKFIQAADVSNVAWIQDDGSTLEAVQWQGATTEILPEFEVNTEISPGAIQFLPHSEEFIFVAIQNGDDQVKVWKTSLEQEHPQVLLERKDSSYPAYQVSPDGKYLGLVEQTLEGYSLLFFNLKTNHVDFEWPYPFTRTNPEFIWSPDSRSIAMIYEGPGNSAPSAASMGIQIMDVESGKLEVLLETGVTWLLGWQAAQ